MFGNKYVSFTSPDESGQGAHLARPMSIKVSGVTTEFNTLFETITSISEKVDPVKLNLTLRATAEALTGLGDKFGQSMVNGNAILDESIRRCRRSAATSAGAGRSGRRLHQRFAGSVERV